MSTQPEDSNLIDPPIEPQDPVTDTSEIAQDATEHHAVVEPIATTQEPIKLEVVKQNVHQEYDHTKGVENFNELLEVVPLPSNTTNVVSEVLRNTDNAKLDDSDKNAQWATILAEGQDHVAFNDAFLRTLEDPDSEFRQVVQTPSGVLAASSPSFNNTNNETLTGERATMRVMSALGIGRVFRFPLYNSGMWITFKAPSEVSLLELNRLMVADKIELGRKQYGLIFSNQSAILTDRLVSFALDHVLQTNINNPDAVDLRTLISSNDIPTLLWGLINTIYPNGFQYQRSCIADPEKCQHVISDRINLAKLQWTNIRGLTNWQLSHMSKVAKNSIDIPSVKRYKDELLKAQNVEIKLSTSNNTDINFVLKVPTVAEYIESGHRWISDVTSMANKALGLDVSNNERNRFIITNGQATSMRQYLHWTDKIKMGNENDGYSTIEDRSTLENVFNELSADDNIRNGFIKEVGKYIDDSTITVIGIPVFDCPVCGGENKPAKVFPKLTNIIPIDVQQTFFTLLVQKIQRIEIR